MFDNDKIEEAIITKYKAPGKDTGAMIRVSTGSGITMLCAWPLTDNSFDAHWAALEGFCKKYPGFGSYYDYSCGSIKNGFAWVKNNDPDR